MSTPEMSTASQDIPEMGSRRGMVHDCAWSTLAAGMAVFVGYSQGVFAEVTRSALATALSVGLPSAVVVVGLFGYSERARERWQSSFWARALPLVAFIFGVQYLYGQFPVTTTLTMLVFSTSIVPLRAYLYVRSQ